MLIDPFGADWPPMGDLKLIYTPTAIIIAQVVISFPVVTGLTAAALQALDPDVADGEARLRGLGQHGRYGKQGRQRGQEAKSLHDDLN